MPKILTASAMRETEAAADAAGVTYATMMERAGKAVAYAAIQRMATLNTKPPRVAVLVGKGNNGGDGLVAAQIIKERSGALITVFMTDAREGDAAVDALRDAGVLIADAATDAEQGYRVLKTMVANADIIIDAILGTGAKLPIKGDLEKILRNVHKALKDRFADQPPIAFNTPSATPAGTKYGDTIPQPWIIAVDSPTGLDVDSGKLDPDALFANETITFEAAKPGLLAFPGAQAVGLLRIAPLDLPPKIKTLTDAKQSVADAEMVRGLLPARPDDGSKGTFGKVMVAAGSLNYTGATALAATAAYRVGAGLVTIATPQSIIPVVGAHVLEATWLPLPHDMGVLSKNAARILLDSLAGYNALLIGPGLGQDSATAEFINEFFSKETSKPKSRGSIGFIPVAKEPEAKPSENTGLPALVIDADGLNLLAKIENWHTLLPARSILTPHPGEMGRLCGFNDDDAGSGADKVQADRLVLATQKAAEWNQVLVLKGAFTIVAEPDGRVCVMPFATSALSKAGTGDVLAGMITGLLGQGLDPYDAAIAGAYLHGYAATLATAAIGSPASVIAGDLLNALGQAVGHVTRGLGG